MEDGNGSYSSSSSFVSIYSSDSEEENACKSSSGKSSRKSSSDKIPMEDGNGSKSSDRKSSSPKIVVVSNQIPMEDGNGICSSSIKPRRIRLSRRLPYYHAGGPQKRCKLHGNFVIIRPKFPAQTIFDGVTSKKIPEEETICRFCYEKFFFREGVVMLKCGCDKNTLAHESCRNTNQNNNNCACGHELQISHVTLSLEPSSNPPKPSTLQRIWFWLWSS